MPATANLAPDDSRLGRIGPFALTALLAAFVLLCLDGLARAPIVHGDEMWNAAPAWKLATQGIYGSDLFDGFHGAEHRTYQFMPLLQLLLALDFAVFGTGILPLRLLSVAAGVVVLALTYAIGKRVGGPRVGLVAVWLLVGFRLASGHLETGIVLVDLARQTRYHIVASAFGLASLLVFLGAQSKAREPAGPRSSIRPYFAAGALAGLAFLSHVYGAFWVPALLAALVVRLGPRQSLRPGLALAVGFVAVTIPWWIYVATDLSAYAGQMRMYGDRFALGDPAFYVTNLLREPSRYFPFGRRDISLLGLGTVVALVGVPLAMIRAGRFAIRDRAHPRVAVLTALVVIVVMFALLLQRKTFYYLLTPLPLAIVILADGAAAFFANVRRPVRWALVGLAVLTTAEAGIAVVRRQRAMSRTTSYDELMRQVAQHVPPSATVVAPHRYWMGLRDRTFRSWLLPLMLSDSLTNAAPIPLDITLRKLDPDILVLDQEFGGYFDALADPATPRHWQYQQLQRFLRERPVRVLAEIPDQSYGTITIYGLR